VPNVPPELIVDGEPINAFLKDFSPQITAIGFCVNENLIDLKSWDPKVCGLVLFAPNPSAVIPTRAGVRISRYATREDDPERDHDPPVCDIGEGLNTGFQSIKEWRLKIPIVEEGPNSVTGTIPHSYLARPEELVLEFLAKNASITNKQGRDLTGIKSENAM